MTTSSIGTTVTAYLDDMSSTVTVMKRSATLLPRGAVVPSFFTQYARRDISAACTCLSMPTPTYTRFLQARPAISESCVAVLHKKSD